MQNRPRRGRNGKPGRVVPTWSGRRQDVNLYSDSATVDNE